MAGFIQGKKKDGEKRFEKHIRELKCISGLWGVSDYWKSSLDFDE